MWLFYRLHCIFVFSFSLQIVEMTKYDKTRKSSLLLATKGYRLQGHVIRSSLVTSSVECAQYCMFDHRCESLNYRHSLRNMDPTPCELNNSTKQKDRAKFSEDETVTYYDLASQVQANVEMDTAKVLPQPVFKSCLDVQTYNKSYIDGEYQLQISYPACNKTVQVYCADMNTTTPLEYVTLKAGSAENFSKKNYVGSVKQNTFASTKTEFSKIRIQSDLTVTRHDYRFATITWFYHNKVYAPYASAADCYQSSCSSTKKGIFKMDLTGTGLRFVTPIDWGYSGHRSCSSQTPNQYTMSTTKQIASGRCGGYCGRCNAKTLSIEPEGC